MSLNREFLIWKERGLGGRGEREKGVGGQVSRSYLRLGKVWETKIEGRDKDRET
jgi:hypothetical protein